MKPVVLVFVGTYLPGYKSGGPVRSIANLVHYLGEEIDFRIVTSDRDVFDSAPYPNVVVDRWNAVGKAQVYYRSGGQVSPLLLGKVFEMDFDVLYLNSFFAAGFSIIPLIAWRLMGRGKGSVVIAPRGEFSKGALGLKKWKKLAYIQFARKSGFYRDLIWQASAEPEAEDIRRTMKSHGRVSVATNIFVAPDAPSFLPGDSEVCRKHRRGGELRILFLSRVSRKKNLHGALRILRDVKTRVSFDVVGPIFENGYWRECQMITSSLPRNVRVRYLGPIEQAEVHELVKKYDLFFLPTLGENYGHAIIEALAGGTPVLISDQTPWKGDDSGACRTFQIGDDEGFGRAIEETARLSGEEYLGLRIAAVRLARAYSAVGESIERNRQLFKIATAMARGA